MSNDQFILVDIPEIPEDEMRRITGLVKPIIADYMRKSEQMAQHVIVKPIEFPKHDPAKPMVGSETGDWSW